MVGMTLNVEAQEPILHTDRRRHTRESFSEVRKRHKKKEKEAIVRAPLIMPWHLQTLRHRVQLSITGARLTRATEVSQ